MASNKSTWSRIRSRLTDPQKKFAQTFADDFLTRVKQRTPNPPLSPNPGSAANSPSTGKLRKGWKANVSKTQVTIYNDVEYAGYVEDGTEKMNGTHMLKTTAAETPQISQAAYRKVKKK